MAHYNSLQKSEPVSDPSVTFSFPVSGQANRTPLRTDVVRSNTVWLDVAAADTKDEAADEPSRGADTPCFNGEQAWC